MNISVSINDLKLLLEKALLQNNVAFNRVEVTEGPLGISGMVVYMKDRETTIWDVLDPWPLES